MRTIFIIFFCLFIYSTTSSASAVRLKIELGDIGYYPSGADYQTVDRSLNLKHQDVVQVNSSSYCELQFSSGNKAYPDANCQFRILSDGERKVEQTLVYEGSFHAYNDKGPMIIRTPHARIAALKGIVSIHVKKDMTLIVPRKGKKNAIYVKKKIYVLEPHHFAIAHHDGRYETKPSNHFEGELKKESQDRKHQNLFARLLDRTQAKEKFTSTPGPNWKNEKNNVLKKKWIVDTRYTSDSELDQYRSDFEPEKHQKGRVGKSLWHKIYQKVRPTRTPELAQRVNSLEKPIYETIASRNKLKKSEMIHATRKVSNR